jgi:hypothetical protein
MKTPRSRSRRSRRWFASHMSVAIIPIRGHRQSSPRLPRAKLIGDDHHELEQLQVESEDTREFASAFSRDVSKMSEWRQNGSLEIPSRLLKSQMERVKGIEPSYSAWKAAALPLSYTRLPVMTYHAVTTVSTAPWPVLLSFKASCSRTGLAAVSQESAPASPLTDANSRPILLFPRTRKGGDSVSYSKRCHLAGIAR